MTYIEAHTAYLADWKTRQALVDELDEDGYTPMTCQWEDILKAMRDRQEREDILNAMKDRQEKEIEDAR